MRAFVGLVGLVLSVGLAYAKPPSGSFAQDLRKQLSPGAEVFTPSDPGWGSNVTQRWTIYGAPSYQAAVKPATELDVQKSVKIAIAHKIPFLATGGGHGYTTTFKYLEEGLEIDLSNFKSVKVDAAKNEMTIGGAVRFRDIFDPLYNAGKEIQTGSCSCVGMVGASLGAGVGRYQGIHGLIIDALKSISMVTASGNLITVSASQNPELFWGMRGGGGNFGIITSATYKIFDHTNKGQVLNADMKFAAKDNGTYWKVMRSFQDRLPAELSLFTLTIFDPDLKAPIIILNAVYAGDQKKGRQLLKPFFDMKPIQQNVTTIPWNVLSTSSLFGLDSFFCVNGGNHNLYALGTKNLDVPTLTSHFNRLVKFWKDYPEAQSSSFEIELFPTQAVLAVPDDATAYPWRDIQAQVMFTFDYPAGNATLDKVVNAFARDARSKFNKVTGFDQMQVYTSYAHGDESPEEIYGAKKLPKLLELKKKWDPTNQFRFNNPLPFKP